MLAEELSELLTYLNPSAVLVQGDTTSALVAALTAFYQKIPVGHVEAGLRTHDEYDPFPEEKNRQMIARLARWHFTPTSQATKNLIAEGISESQIFQVGNTVVDAVQWGTTQLNGDLGGHTEVLPPSLKTLPTRLPGRRLVLITAHRRENWGAKISQIAQAARRLLEQERDLVVVWPVHPNPKVHMTVATVFQDLAPEVAERLYLTPGLSYPVVLWLLKRAWLVLTDSGGIQEEAAAIKLPVLVLRQTTERPELVTSGLGIMVGTEPEAIIEHVLRLGRNVASYQAMRRAENPFGDGRAATYIGEVLTQAFVGDGARRH